MRRALLRASARPYESTEIARFANLEKAFNDGSRAWQRPPASDGLAASHMNPATPARG